MYTMTLYLQNGNWMAHSNDPQIKELFGTDTLPTAFNSQMSIRNVIVRLQEKNPNLTIVEGQPA